MEDTPIDVLERLQKNIEEEIELDKYKDTYKTLRRNHPYWVEKEEKEFQEFKELLVEASKNYPPYKYSDIKMEN